MSKFDPSSKDYNPNAQSPLQNFQNPWDALGDYAQQFLNVDSILDVSEVLNLDGLFGNAKKQDSLNENYANIIENIYDTENNVQFFDNTIHNIITKDIGLNIFVAGVPQTPLYLDSKDYTEVYYKTQTETRHNMIMPKIDYALTYDLKYARKNPNLIVLTFNDIKSLKMRLEYEILQAKRLNYLDDVYIKNIYFSSHGGYDSPYFMIGNVLIDINNIQRLSELKSLITEKTNFVITACNTGAGNNPENAEKFLLDVATYLNTTVIAYRSWGYPKVTDGKYNLALGELNGIDNWKTRINSLLFMGQSIRVSPTNLQGPVFNPINIEKAFRINHEGDIEYMNNTEFNLIERIIAQYNTKRLRNIKDFYFYLYNMDRLKNSSYRHIYGR